MATKPQPAQSGNVIFRRYRRTRNGKVLDAHEYGIEAWPIRIRAKKRKH